MRLVSTFVLFLGLAAPASALPPVGSRPPDVRLEDADGGILHVARAAPRPVLVVYESRDSSAQNAALKRELSEIARGGAYRDDVVLAPVAWLEGLDYFPVSRLVRRAIRAESRDLDATIYCDWSGAFARAWGLQPALSSVVLLGRSGHVRFAAEGPLPPAARRELIALLRDQT